MNLKLRHPNGMTGRLPLCPIISDLLPKYSDGIVIR